MRMRFWHSIICICTIWIQAATSMTITKYKYNYLPVSDYPSFLVRCQVFYGSLLRCATWCHQEGCYMFGVENDACVVCRTYTEQPLKPLGPIPFSRMYRIGM